jgi:hypothetical protein
LGYIKPPDLLLTQLKLYTEEKSEDEEDMHERTRHLLRERGGISERPRAESEVALEDLVLLVKQHDNLYPVMVDILKHYCQIIQRDIGMYVILLHLVSFTGSLFLVNLRRIFSEFSTVLSNKLLCLIACE